MIFIVLGQKTLVILCSDIKFFGYKLEGGSRKKSHSPTPLVVRNSSLNVVFFCIRFNKTKKKRFIATLCSMISIIALDIWQHSEIMKKE